jgi:FemAB-related protein (PEP-CTERM system-associated)
MPLLRARPFTSEDTGRWDEFVQRCPEATFFHRIGWRKVLEGCFGHRTHYLLAERGTSIVGILPLAEVKSLLFGHALVSLPFCEIAGVAASDDEAKDELHRAARGLAEKLGAGHLELRNSAPREAAWPRQSLYVGFRKALASEAEANMLAIPRKQRAMVRKGLKNGLQSEIDGGVDRFFALYASNVHRHGTPALPRRYFVALREVFGAHTEIMTVSDAQRRPLSAVLSFYFRDEVLPYYAGDDESARDLAANDFKYWELMRRACARGIKTFDYGRSKRGTGSYAFKKNWGFEPLPLHYEYCLYKRDAVPQNNPSNARYRFLIEAWRRMPIALANRVGPLVVRSLG